ncbi:MAG: hypothetical protein HOE88_01820 [Flavobacteriales bacterium]|jgi:hypothetical protein|nr:hypothetical protein [Flavobacteriales bacterium]MBT3572263.1 hypothetical protein [Flavobacteriales bacterium]MBT3678065.1 hypothetical protein [Flavobacteriales bacterium]MBT3739341.1 hypothetical protein [Flavobacteriales bacterium]MBT4102110.1 hypothetical protein [Flavobacteriales bacterium]
MGIAFGTQLARHVGMKYLLLVAFLVSGFHLAAQDSDLNFYLRSGINFNTSSLGLDSGLTSAGQILNQEIPNNGYHLGFSLREYKNDGQFLALDAGYHETSFDLVGIDPNGNPVTQTLTSQTIQAAISPGFRLFRFIRAQAGINCVFQLNEDFQSTFDSYKLGYRLGSGLDFGNISIDAMYIASFMSTDGTFSNIPLSSNTSNYLLGLSVKL